MSSMEQVCLDYMEAAEKFIQAREDYRLAFAKFSTESQAKTEAARKAEADLKTSQLRVERDKLEVIAAVAWQALLVARGPMTYSIQPLQKFGDR
jgi:hypothetical protein